MRHAAYFLGIGLLAASAAACGSDGNGGSVGPGRGGTGGGRGGRGGTGGDPTGEVVPGTGTGPKACNVAGTPTRLASGMTARLPSITASGDGYLVFWSDQRTGAGKIFGVRVSKDGAPSGGEFMAVDTGNNALSPRAANGVLVWEDCRSSDCSAGGPSAVSAVSIGSDGKASGTVKEISAVQMVQRRPHVVRAFDKTYVTFRDLEGGKVVSRLGQLSADGSLSTPVTIGGGNEAAFPHVSTNGDRLAVVYVRGKTDVGVALYNESLAPQGEQMLRTGASEAFNPVGVWTGNTWAFAWEDRASGGDEQLYTAAVAKDGKSAEQGRLAYETGNWPAMASGGGGAVVAFYGFTSKDGGPFILVSPLDDAGNQKGPVIRVTQKKGGRFPSLAHNGGAYGLVWEERASGSEGVYFARLNCQ